MRTSAVTILGLVAAAAALPATSTGVGVEKRDEITLGQVTVPLQRAAIQRGIDQIKAFLAKNTGVDIDVSNPGVISIFEPGLKKRGGRHERPENIFAILDQWTALTTERYDRHHAPPAPVYLVACQLAQLLLDAGIDIDTSILQVWSHFQIADKVKRQDGIFTLPGSCNIDDIIGLETILATIMLIYGNEPPAHIQSLRNAVTAALLFCGVAEADAGGMIPDRPSQGGGIIPDKPSEGGALEPDNPSKGGPLVPDRPSEGGNMVPDKPDQGGKMKPDNPSEGGDLEPEDPVIGGPIKPSDRKKRSLHRRQHPSLDLDALLETLAQLEDAYGSFGSGDIPMPIFIIMQTIVALLQSYGQETKGWPDLVGDSVSMIPPSTGAMVPDTP